MKILFCTDGSETSFSAIKNSRNWTENAGVDIISVIDWNFLPDEINLEAPGFYEFCANSADNILNLAKKEVEKAGFTAGKLIKHCGSVSESILEELENGSYDLAVLGSHGKKGIQSWLGSVSRKVSVSGKTCVYTAKQENNSKRILFTTDGTVKSSEGIIEAVSHIKLNEKEIYICMVNEEPGLLFLEGTLDTNWLIKIENQQRDYAQKAIEDIKKIIVQKGYEVKETAVLTGNPAQKILEYSKNNNIDLIVMSSKHKEEKSAFLGGSVCKRVLENTASDVIIAKKHLF
ncbi:MAG: universal stress protein [Heliobacteriaceae bacterium]|jgi:nucleotide-binding universal stress UspA family protein|nr:universal stress protein [Heliobacteriaceae bacterium]